MRTRRERGAITVFLTIILIPSILITGFMGDLMRIKMFNNMAIMAADTYGEAILTQYDNVLRQVYGLFAVSQGNDGSGAELEEFLETAEEEILSSYNPQKTTFAHDFITQSTELSGFIPYRNVDADLTYENVKGATLANEHVLGTQIDDFMKFRVAQELLKEEDNGGGGIFDTLDSLRKSAGDSAVTNKKLRYDRQADKVLSSAKDFYEGLEKHMEKEEEHFELRKKMHEYRNAIIDTAKREKEEEDRYREEILGELEERAEYSDEEPPEEITIPPELDIDVVQWRQERCADVMWENYWSLNSDINNYKTDIVNGYHNQVFMHLSIASDELYNGMVELNKLRGELDEALKRGDVSEDTRKGISNEIATYDKLFGAGEGNLNAYLEYAQKYKDMADYLRKNEEVAELVHRTAEEGIPSYKEFIEDFLAGGDPDETAIQNPDDIPFDDWKKIDQDSTYKQIYDSLKEFFAVHEKTKGEEMRDKAKELEKEKAQVFKQDETTDARDVPGIFPYGDGQEVHLDEENPIDDLVEQCTGYFGGSNNAFVEGVKRALSKFLLVEYDFGMFTCRTTNISGKGMDGNAQESEEKETTLTGIEKMPRINYMYRAELEYVLGGHRKSAQNLKTARNRILAFRAVINYITSYRIKEINEPITEAARLAGTANPLIGLAVGAGLRALFSGIETYGDWDELKKGESVTLFKSEIKELTAYEEFEDFLSGFGGDSGSSGGVENVSDSKERPFAKLNYEQYMQVMVMFFIGTDTAFRRTSHLITINMNNIKGKVPENGTITQQVFDLNKMPTAVDSRCAVQGSFIVMPEGFIRLVMPQQYSSFMEFENNQYQFSVIRSY